MLIDSGTSMYYDVSYVSQTAYIHLLANKYTHRTFHITMGRSVTYGSNYVSVPKDEIRARLSRRMKQRRDRQKVRAVRIRNPPTRFSQETYLPGANNARTKGRIIDSFDRSFNGYVWFDDAVNAEDTEYVPMPH